MACSEAEDAGGLTPAKDDNEAARYFSCRTLPIFNCVDYTISFGMKFGKIRYIPNE